MRKPLLAQTGVAILLALVAASSASARTVVGAPLDVTPNSTLGGSSTPSALAINTAAPSVTTLPINTPSAGVVTEIRVRHGAVSATPSVLGLRIASGSSPNFSLRKISGVPDATWPKNDPAGVYTARPADQYGRPTGVPISVGETIAMLRVGTTGSEPTALLTGTGGTLAYGTDRATEGTITGLGNLGATALVQWVVEPDVDADGYGDDSQDKCVGTAGPCLPVATGPDVIKEVIKEVPVVQTVTVTETKEVPVVQTVTVPSAACVTARQADVRATNTLKKAKAALKKRKSAANSKKVAAAKKTLAQRDAEVKVQC